METPFRSTPNALRRELAQRSDDGLDVTLLWCRAAGQNDE